MEFDRLSLITTSGLKDVLRDGGHIKYQRLEFDGALGWMLFGFGHDGKQYRVVSPNRLNDRFFPKADALINFHIRQFPDDKEISLPLVTGDWSQEYPTKS